MSITATQSNTLKLTGNGLITGLPVSVEIQKGEPGRGVVFFVQPAADQEPSIPIAARLESVVHTERGVTLSDVSGAAPTGQTLSIVEHFLCGAAMAGHSDLNVYVTGAPELPILDGSAQVWYEALVKQFGEKPVEADITLKNAVFYRHDEQVCLYALPAEHFQVSYAVDYDHPELKNQWIRWDSKVDPLLSVAKARTYGYLRELPALQAQGLAKGVSLENTLGLTDDGTYTSPLRIEVEPIYHKVLDLMGDLMLTGINPRRLKAHVYAIHGGHGGHTAFAKRLLPALVY